MLHMTKKYDIYIVMISWSVKFNTEQYIYKLACKAQVTQLLFEWYTTNLYIVLQ